MKKLLLRIYWYFYKVHRVKSFIEYLEWKKRLGIGITKKERKMVQ